jgi:hypothetical protein
MPDNDMKPRAGRNPARGCTPSLELVRPAVGGSNTPRGWSA